jgi:membrane fusion protein, adhesin transport system
MILERRWNYLITVVPIIAFFVVFFVWSAFSEIDEVVRGEGKVVPSGQTKVLQHLEGGIVAEILVNEGDNVRENQPIYRLDQAFFTADLKEKDTEILSLHAKEQRLMSLIEDKGVLVFAKEIQEKVPQIAQDELQIFYSERQNMAERLGVVSQKMEQRKLEIKDLEAKFRNLSFELDTSRENAQIAEQLMKSGAGSRKEYLAELSKKQNLATQLDDIKNQIPLAKEKLKEAMHEAGSVRTEIRTKHLNELKEVRTKKSQTTGQSEASSDRTKRLIIASPVHGIVQKLYFHTIGGAIKAGDKVAEITPVEGGVMIEADIAAADRARIWIGQKATIEITAYDYARYGRIDGEVISISPDSFNDQKGRIFYSAKVKAAKDRYSANKPILPGMVANVNIVTGKRTVLEYIMIPFKRVGQNALLEP